MKCNAKIIGQRISALRKDQGLKQVELAKKLNVSRQIISYYETGARFPNIEDITALAEVLETSTDYLLGLTSTSSTDTDLIAVCDYTGLSEKTVSMLHEWSEEDFAPNHQYSKLIDKIVDNEFVLASAYIYQKKSEEYMAYRNNLHFDVSFNSDKETLKDLSGILALEVANVEKLKTSYYEAIEAYQLFIRAYIFDCPIWNDGGGLSQVLEALENRMLRGKPNGNDNEEE